MTLDQQGPTAVATMLVLYTFLPPAFATCKNKAVFWVCMSSDPDISDIVVLQIKGPTEQQNTTQCELRAHLRQNLQ